MGDGNCFLVWGMEYFVILFTKIQYKTLIFLLSCSIRFFNIEELIKKGGGDGLVDKSGQA